jgi:hypothetical protein
MKPRLMRPGLDMADDVIGGTAFDMQADIGIFAGNA